MVCWSADFVSCDARGREDAGARRIDGTILMDYRFVKRMARSRSMDYGQKAEEW